MFRVTLQNVDLKRTIRPLYAYSQATPQGFTLAASEAAKSILPGTVLCNVGNNEVKVADGTLTPTGLSAHFAGTNEFGVDEVMDSGIDAIGVWVGGNDSQFEILAPAFDTGTDEYAVDWVGAKADLAAGNLVLLVPNADGLLTIATGDEAEGQALCRLVDVVGDTSIIVTFA